MSEEDEDFSKIYGGGLDLVTVRVLDMAQVTIASEFYLKQPLLSETARKGLVLFAVYRGENARTKLENFVLRKCKVGCMCYYRCLSPQGCFPQM